MADVPKHRSKSPARRARPACTRGRSGASRPQSDREAGDAVVSNFLLHWFPAKVLQGRR